MATVKKRKEKNISAKQNLYGQSKQFKAFLTTIFILERCGKGSSHEPKSMERILSSILQSTLCLRIIISLSLITKPSQ